MKIIILNVLDETSSWRAVVKYDALEEAVLAGGNQPLIYKIESIAELEKLLAELSQAKDCLVFNFTEYLHNDQSLPSVPELLERYRVPFVGCDHQSMRRGLDKFKAKQLFLSAGVPTPDFYQANSPREVPQKTLNFPVLVKPCCEGSSRGIDASSICYDDQQVKEKVKIQVEKYKAPALVEEYLEAQDMREFTVAVLGNRQYLTSPTEYDFGYLPQMPEVKILTTPIKMEHAKHMLREIEKAAGDYLSEYTIKAYQAVGAIDFARFDWRSKDGKFYLLEANMMPGISKLSLLTTCLRVTHGLDYNKFINILLYVTMKRYGLVLTPEMQEMFSGLAIALPA